jgi:membrane dipeptidase
MTAHHTDVPIFDGHNDALLEVLDAERGGGRSFLERSDKGHLDLPRAKAGGMVGGLFAGFVPNPKGTVTVDGEPRPPIEVAYAQKVADDTLSLMQRIERESGGAAKQVRSVADIRRCMREGSLAMGFHLEGAEPIEVDLSNLGAYYEKGLRSIGLVWARPNAFGYGVPFRNPSSPDIGPRLSEAGIALVKACDEMGIVVDVSHLNERGFFDVAKHSTKPMVASHSGVHKLCPASRNLTDEQLDAIKASGGVVGVVFAVVFIRPDGANNDDTPVDLIAEHVAYVAERIGVEHVAFGSDFDGAKVPAGLCDAAGYPAVIAALRRRGFSEADLRKIACENWLRVLERTWKSD